MKDLLILPIVILSIVNTPTSPIRRYVPYITFLQPFEQNLDFFASIFVHIEWKKEWFGKLKK